ncbi:MAG: sigma-54-dependent Fis family transcriptional regulator, partial [Burkholderiaceae bacterium]|nr:sigma-54-dependent Fis family transcriptional regulator [Burkholderiaceae bacterium]
MANILVVDDEMGIRELLSEILGDEGHAVQLAENAQQAREARAVGAPDLVLLDIWMPDTDGVTLLKEWQRDGLLTMPVIMMSGHATIDTAVEATRIGALNFLEKPIALQKLLATVGRALKHGGEQPQASFSLAELGRAPIIAELKQRLEHIVNLRTPVLLVAEPGCGIELCARFLHPRNTPWVSLESNNHLAEAPLDLVEQAREGTLFVHEVAELNRIEQRGLLLLLSKLDRYNARVIVGGTRQLPDIVAAGGFDPRLYAALAGTAIHIPSLREHREDIPDLANLVLSQMIEAKEIPAREFSTAALNALRNYDWPGNLLQLQACVRSLAQSALNDLIALEVVERSLPQPANAPQPTFDLPLDVPLR